MPGVVSEHNMLAHMVIMVQVAFCRQMIPVLACDGYHTNLSMLIMHKFPDNRVICKVTLSLGMLAPSIPSFSGVCKVRNFFIIKSHKVSD